VLELAGDQDPNVRACAAASVGRLTRDSAVRQHALVDPDARVRVTGILAAWTHGMGNAARRRIAVLAIADPSAEVRTAARFALSQARPKLRRGQWLEDAARPFPWAPSSAPAWLEVEIGGETLWVPALAMAGRRFAIAPGLAGAIAAAE
jgi:HEAT repeat protein